MKVELKKEGTEFEDNPLYESQETTDDDTVNQYSLANAIKEDKINARTTTREPKFNEKYEGTQEAGTPNEPKYFCLNQ